MHFLICPSAYKGTLTSRQIAEAIARGVRSHYADALLTLAPIADGGDGTIDALQMAVGGVVEFVTVGGPVDTLVTAKWIRLDHIGVVELASASGLGYLTGKDLHPLEAHTFGLGQVVSVAIESGIKKLVICVGGSASTDGGSGVLRALGAKFLDAGGNELPLGGGSLRRLERCDLGNLTDWRRKCEIEVAVDVSNPLLGPSGAAQVFGPQKGATPEEVRELDESLRRFADVLEPLTGRICRDLPGAGAAGGTAFGIATGLDAKITSGFTWLSNLMDLDSKIRAADVVITAEGSLDEQSLLGKATGELAASCRRHARPLVVLPAVASAHVDWSAHGIERVIPVARRGCLATAADVENGARSLSF